MCDTCIDYSFTPVPTGQEHRRRYLYRRVEPHTHRGEASIAVQEECTDLSVLLPMDFPLLHRMGD